MFLNIITAILFLLLFSFIFLWLPLGLPIFVRAYRLKYVAKKFGLSYRVGIKLQLLSQVGVRQTNILSGLLNGKTIKVWDSFDDQNIKLPVIGEIRSFGVRSTRLSIDDKQYILKKSGVGYASSTTIQQALQEIIEKKIPSTTSTIEKSPFAYNIFIPMWIILFVLTILANYFAK